MNLKNLTVRLRLGARLAAAATVATLGLTAIPAAHADPMLLKAATTMVYGTSADTYSIVAPSAGTLTAQVSSVPWPVPLAALSFNMSSGNDILSAQPQGPTAQAFDSGPQIEAYQVGAGTYFAHVSAAAAGALNLGLYSVLFTFTPSAVPLPASAGFLLIALMVFFGLRRTIRGTAAGIEEATFGAAHN
jgi:hypothetical protein